MTITELNHSMFDATVSTINVGIIGDEIMQYVYTINFSIICLVVSLFGIVANGINIVVFLSQGFQETINISLIGLAISDFCSLITLLWVSICYNPFFMYSNHLAILTIDLQHFTGGWTHVIFTRVTGFITVYITFERFVCVSFPLKVKNILTPKRVKFIIIAIYVIIIASMSPSYSIFYLGWKYVDSLNTTMLGNIHLHTSDKLFIRTMCYYMQLFYLLTSFTAVVIFTYLLVSKLNQRGKWRQSITPTTTISETNTRATTRDRQVVKMVIHLALIFIISYIPSLVLFALMVTLPGVNNGEQNDNLFMLTYSISFILEGINSSANIFVYYKTSSKYKQQFEFCILGVKKSIPHNIKQTSKSIALKTF